MKQQKFINSSIKLGLALLFAIGFQNCKKGESPEPEQSGEKFIQRIDRYTSTDMTTASNSVAYMYNDQNQITQTVSSIPNRNSTTTKFTYVGEKVSEIEISVDNYIRNLVIDYSDGEHITVVENSYNNGNPDKSVFYRYDSEEKTYRVRDGSYEDYVYLNNFGDPMASDFTMLQYEYDATKKGPFYAFKDNFNFNSVKSLLLASAHFVYPVTKHTYYFGGTSTYQNKFDNEGYLIESEGTTVNGSYFRNVYTYTLR